MTRYPTISKQLFITQRKRLAADIKPHSIVVFNSNDIMPTDADGVMKFHQNSDLLYFTGINQEETILMVCPDFPDKRYREVLFLRETNDTIAVWEGHKLTQAEARAQSGIETVMWLSEFPRLFHHMMVMGGVEHVYLNSNEHYRSEVVVQTRDARFVEWCQARYPLHNYHRIAPHMARLRSAKHPIEVQLLEKACAITEAAFRRILPIVRDGVKEYEIEAEYLYEFVRSGSRGFAYDPIVASGINACALHYTANDSVCHDGDLVLIDAGAEYARYNADLTRTIPVSGKYTNRQRDVYSSVLKVMREAMAMLRPGVMYFDYHKEVQKCMEAELISLGLITQRDVDSQPPDKPAVMKYFMHGTSHQLGLNVHDVGNMYASMCEGQVWTVEPGIYIPEEKLGVRIENDVVITADGTLDLMKNIPIEIDEIETLMNEGKKR